MQKFTRAVTREIEIGGERWAVTFSNDGLALRPVGSRRPPRTMSWPALVCALAHAETAAEPSAEDLATALRQLKSTPATPRPAPPAAPLAADHPPASPSTDHQESTLLSRLEKWLAEHRPRYLHGLRPGASAAEIDALQHELGLPLPSGLRLLLAWHNGQQPELVGSLEESWRLMGTPEIRQRRAEVPNHAWIPFLEDDAGSYLCLDTTQPSAPVRGCWAGKTDHPVVAPSLSAWLESFVAGIEGGAYVEDPERGHFLKR